VMFSQPIRISQVNICTDVHYNANDVLAFCIPGADTHYYIGHAICPFYFLNEDVSNDVTESWLINHIRERQAKWIGHVMRGNTHSLSSFNGYFPGGPGLAGTRMSSFWISLELRVMEVVVLTAARRRAMLQSNCHHQQTNTQHFYRPDALHVA